MKCDVCSKEFASKRALSSHIAAAHKEGPRYTKSRKRNPDSVCKNCSKVFGYNSSSTNKFCSLDCYHEHKWERVEKPKIISGKGGNYKKYLFESRGEKCEECGQEPIHNNKPLTLQIDHVDGNSDNNALENLRILCPNCHTQTETYGAKGQGNKFQKNTKRNNYLRKYKCPIS